MGLDGGPYQEDGSMDLVEALDWGELLETEPALDELLPIFAALEPGESMPGYFDITNVPRLNLDQESEALGDLDTFSLAIEEAARKRGITLPAMSFSIEALPGLVASKNGKTAWSRVSGIWCVDSLDEEKFVGDWAKVTNAIAAKKSIDFNFVPKDIENFSIAYIQNFFISRGVDISQMDFSISPIATSAYYTQVRVAVEPKRKKKIS